MVRIKIREVAERKGIANPFQLMRLTGLKYAVCHLYWNGEPKQISTDALDKLCDALDVKPGQLFEYTRDK